MTFSWPKCWFSVVYFVGVDTESIPLLSQSHILGPSEKRWLFCRVYLEAPPITWGIYLAGIFLRSRRARSRSRRSRRNSGRFSRRDDPEPSRCLGVFGLSLYTTERDLKVRIQIYFWNINLQSFLHALKASFLQELFSQYGEVENVQLVFDHPTGRSRGFGFVYFEKLEDAMLAKDRVAGTEIDGHKVKLFFFVRAM